VSRVEHAQTGRRSEVVFVQDSAHYWSRVVPRLVSFGMIVVGVVGATVFILQDLQSNPLAPRAYFLLPVIVWAILLEVLLVVGWQLTRSRFVVWSNAFAPPFRRPRFLAPKLPPLIPFQEVEEMVPGFSTASGQEHVYAVSVVLKSGERLDVRAGDVGTAGVEALLRAWSAPVAQAQSDLKPGNGRRTPPWVGREWRTQAVIGVLLISILLLEALLVFSASTPAAAGAVAFIGVVVLGSAFAVWTIVSARSRKRQVEEIYRGRLMP